MSWWFEKVGLSLGFLFVCPCACDAVNVLRAAGRWRFPSLSRVAFITQKAIAIVCFLPLGQAAGLAWGWGHTLLSPTGQASGPC